MNLARCSPLITKVKRGSFEASVSHQDAVFMRRAPLIVALVWDGTTLKVYVATAGTYLGVQSISSGSSASFGMSEVRFTNHDATKVSAFNWFGASFAPEVVAESDIKQMFQDLSFLTAA